MNQDKIINYIRSSSKPVSTSEVRDKFFDKKTPMKDVDDMLKKTALVCKASGSNKNMNYWTVPKRCPSCDDFMHYESD